MAEEPEKVIQQIEDNKIAPVYFLQGTEAYYIDQVIELLEQKVIPPDQKGFNEVILYGQDVSVGDVINAARRFPMMYERQLVIVKEAQSIKDIGKKDMAELLTKYVENPLNSTVLAFGFKGKKLDGKTTLMKTLNKKAVVVNSEKIRDYEFGKWINQYFKQKRFEATPEAKNLLAEHIGPDLQKFHNEISKLLLVIDKSQTITPDLIEKYVGISKTYNVFELQKAIGLKQPLRTLQIFKSFSEGQQEIYPVLGNLYNFFTRLVLVHQASDKSENNLMRLLGLNSGFIVREYKQAAQNYPLIKSLSALLALAEADATVKGINGPIPNEYEIYKESLIKIMA